VIVGPREALLTHALTLKETNWLGDIASIEAAAAVGRRVLARVRSTREPVSGALAMIDGAPGVVFDSPEDSVAPGQACALYAAEAPTRVLGGGFIAGTVRAAI
jgi:tRNA-specific 2-thiouridylase